MTLKPSQINTAMLKKAFIGPILLSLSATASAGVMLGTFDCTVDTLQHSVVGPGTKYTAVKFTSTTNAVFRAFFLHIDTTNPDVKIHSELGRDSIIGCENISSHVKRRDAEGRRYFAAVNGDFFATTGDVGTPVYGSVVAGKQATPPPADMPHFIITNEHTPYISTITPTYKMSVNGGETITIDRINGYRGENELALYNDNIGKYTHTSAGGVEVAIELLEGESWKINTPFKVKVVGAKHTNGNMAVASGQGVLSAAGSRATVVENLNEGDIIELSVEHRLGNFDNLMPNITSVMGAFPFLVIDGQKIVYDNPDVHPRTMLGYTKDQKTIIFAVLDGRSTISRGGNFEELSDMMIWAGAHWAVNTDGGGSSSMYLPLLGTMNNPSDGQERAVGNGLYVTLDAPDDNEIAEIRFKDYTGVFPKYGIYTPVFFGYNKYGLLIDTNVQGVTLSCPEGLGEIINDGTTLFGIGSGTHALTASFGDITTSIPVTIETENSPEFKYTDVLIDNFRQWSVDVRTMVREEYMTVNPEALAWTSSDENVATVSNLGIVSGKSDGQTILTGTVGDFTGNINLTVECPTANVMPFEPAFDPATWEVSSKSNIKTVEIAAGENALNLNFTISSTRKPKIAITKNITIWSLPDKLRFTINSGEVTISNLTIKAGANGVQPKSLTFTDLVAGTDNIIEIPVSDIADVNDIGIYPIQFSSFEFVFSGKTSTNYTVSISGMDAIYDNMPSGVEAVAMYNGNNNILALTPCPVKAGEPVFAIVNNEGEAEYTVYSVAGSVIAKGCAMPDSGQITIPTGNITPGVYIVGITQNGNNASSRLIVK